MPTRPPRRQVISRRDGGDRVASRQPSRRLPVSSCSPRWWSAASGPTRRTAPATRGSWRCTPHPSRSRSSPSSSRARRPPDESSGSPLRRRGSRPPSGAGPGPRSATFCPERSTPRRAPVLQRRWPIPDSSPPRAVSAPAPAAPPQVRFSSWTIRLTPSSPRSSLAPPPARTGELPTPWRPTASPSSCSTTKRATPSPLRPVWACPRRPDWSSSPRPPRATPGG